MSSTYYSRNQSYSRSYLAEVAEEEGRLPLTRAIAHIVESAQTTPTIARRVLLAIGSTEWHHVGKYANRVDYYETERAIRISRRVTPAKIRAAVLTRWTRAAWAEARAAATERQLREADLARSESAQRDWPAKAAEEAIIHAAYKAAHVEGLIANYRRHPTPGRTTELKNLGIDPSTL